MQPDNRWARTRDALFRLVSHMPTGAEMGIITVGAGSANVNIEPTVVRESNREGLHGRIPYRLLSDREACLSCGVLKAKELLNPNHLGSIIIVSSERAIDLGAEPNAALFSGRARLRLDIFELCPLLPQNEIAIMHYKTASLTIPHCISILTIYVLHVTKKEEKF